MSLALSRTFRNRSAQCKGVPDTLLRVRNPRSKNPVISAFGARLRELRTEARSREVIARKLATLGVALDESTLVQYEKGTVWAPDAGVLWGLSEIYKVPLVELTTLLVINRADPSAKSWRDLLRQPPDQGSTHGGGVDVPDLTDRLLEIKRRDESLAGDVQDVIGRLTGIAERLQSETSGVEKTSTRSSRRRGKTG